jgi:hypothetical protein
MGREGGRLLGYQTKEPEPDTVPGESSVPCYLLNKHLLRTHCVLSTALGPKDTPMITELKNPPPH